MEVDRAELLGNSKGSIVSKILSKAVSAIIKSSGEPWKCQVSGTNPGEPQLSASAPHHGGENQASASFPEFRPYSPERVISCKPLDIDNIDKTVVLPPIPIRDFTLFASSLTNSVSHRDLDESHPQPLSIYFWFNLEFKNCTSESCWLRQNRSMKVVASTSN